MELRRMSRAPIRSASRMYPTSTLDYGALESLTGSTIDDIDRLAVRPSQEDMDTASNNRDVNQIAQLLSNAMAGAGSVGGKSYDNSAAINTFKQLGERGFQDVSNRIGLRERQDADIYTALEREGVAGEARAKQARLDKPLSPMDRSVIEGHLKKNFPDLNQSLSEDMTYGDIESQPYLDQILKNAGRSGNQDLRLELESMRQTGALDLEKFKAEAKSGEEALDRELKKSDLEDRKKAKEKEAAAEAERGGLTENQFTNLGVKYGQLIDKGGYPEAWEQFNRAKAIVDRYRGKNIPGVGMDKVLGIPVPGRLLPDIALDTDARELRTSLQALANVQLKNRSGTAVTANEMARFLKETATGPWSSQESFIQAFDAAERVLKAKTSDVIASFPEAVYNTQIQRGGTDFKQFISGGGTSAAPSAPSAPAGGKKVEYSASRNKSRITHPDGRVEIVDGDQRGK